MSKMRSEEEIYAEVENLLNKMNLDQKIGQMTQTERMSVGPEEVKNYHLGSVLSGGGSVPGANKLKDWVDMNQAYWLASVEEDEHHLSIPLIYGVDAVHGHNNVLGATIFPHNIGLGAAKDPDLIKRIAQVTAKEILASGVEWTFAPTLAVAQDARWGRMYESYSERPDIIESYASKFVEGLQSDFGDDSVIGCLKHWVGDGGTYNGIDQGDTRISEEELRAIHIRPYLPAIEAGVLSMMVSFNSWNGLKCHGHSYLLKDVLKDELGFKGFLISDWDGIDYLTPDYHEAVKLSVNAGIDMFMVSEKWKDFIDSLKVHVQNGDVPMERIDDSVRRILYVKVKYGLFEKASPAKRKYSGSKSFGSKEHREVARESVRKSLVLLKNQNEILPLKKSARILVAGKNADNCGFQCGGFTVAWQGISDHEDDKANIVADNLVESIYGNSARPGIGKIEGGTSIWQGISKLAPNAVLNENGNLADPKKHDFAVIVIGEKPYAEGMGDIRKNDDAVGETIGKIQGQLKVLQSYGQSLNLSQLHPEDLEVIKKVTDKGIPAVIVLVSGRPLIIDKEIEKADAFVAAWLPGSEGQGVADVLFGDYNFQGKLSFTWPKNESYYDTDKSDQNLVKFPYGYGLQY